MSRCDRSHVAHAGYNVYCLAFSRPSLPTPTAGHGRKLGSHSLVSQVATRGSYTSDGYVSKDHSVCRVEEDWEGAGGTRDSGEEAAVLPSRSHCRPTSVRLGQRLPSPCSVLVTVLFHDDVTGDYAIRTLSSMPGTPKGETVNETVCKKLARGICLLGKVGFSEADRGMSMRVWVIYEGTLPGGQAGKGGRDSGDRAST